MCYLLFLISEIPILAFSEESPDTSNELEVLSRKSFPVSRAWKKRKQNMLAISRTKN